MTYFEGAFHQPETNASDEAIWRWEQQMQQTRERLAYRGIPETLAAIQAWQDTHPGEPLPQELAAYDFAIQHIIAEDERIERDLAEQQQREQANRSARIAAAEASGETFRDDAGVSWYRSNEGEFYCSAACYVDRGCSECRMDWEGEVPR